MPDFGIRKLTRRSKLVIAAKKTDPDAEVFSVFAEHNGFEIQQAIEGLGFVAVGNDPQSFWVIRTKRPKRAIEAVRRVLPSWARNDN